MKHTLLVVAGLFALFTGCATPAPAPATPVHTPTAQTPAPQAQTSRRASSPAATTRQAVDLPTSTQRRTIELHDGDVEETDEPVELFRLTRQDDEDAAAD